MRTRTRNIALATKTWVGGSNSYQNIKCNGTVTNSSQVFAGYTLPYSYILERMTDTTGSVSGPCMHRKLMVNLNPSEGTYIFPDPTSPFGRSVYPDAGANWLSLLNSLTQDFQGWNVSSDVGFPLGVNMSTGSINEAALKEDCLERARELKADVLLNIVEAPQLYNSIGSLARSLVNYKKHWKKFRVGLADSIRKGAFNRSSRRVVRDVSGNYLAYKFGVSPLISDAENVYRFLPKMAAELKSHAERDTLRYSAYAQIPLAAPDESVVKQSINGYSTRLLTRQTVPRRVPTIRYVLVVKPNLKYKTALFNRLQQCIDRFSSTPASLAWEKIPFSFVVDWFVDLRGALRAIDASIGYSPYEVVSFTRSFSYELLVNTQLSVRSPCTGAVLDERPAGSFEYKHYERSLVPITDYSVSWKPRFGKSQAATTAALVTQHLSKVR